MRADLTFVPLASVETPLLAVTAVDTQTSKSPDAKPQPELLTSDAAVRSAAVAILAGGEFKAAANETLLIHAPAGLKAARLLIIGLGKPSKATVHSVRNAAGAAIRFTKPRGIRELVFAIPAGAPEALPPPACARAAVEGAFIGDFDPDTYRSDRKDLSVQAFTVAAPQTNNNAKVEDDFREGWIVGMSQNFTRTLVNEPGNKLTPTEFGRRAAAMAKEVGLHCEVHSTEKLHELKMGAFWSVAQGSAEPPALIVLRYVARGRHRRPHPRPRGQGRHLRYRRHLHQAL